MISHSPALLDDRSNKPPEANTTALTHNKVDQVHNLKSVSFIDFDSTKFGRIRIHPPPSPEELAQFLPCVCISPLLRWHEVSHRADKSEDWIDWDWHAWLESEYAQDEAGIMQGMRDLWLSQRRVDHWYAYVKPEAGRAS